MTVKKNICNFREIWYSPPLYKVAALTRPTDTRPFPYINICLTAIKAAFAGISVFNGIVVFHAFDGEMS